MNSNIRAEHQAQSWVKLGLASATEEVFEHSVGNAIVARSISQAKHAGKLASVSDLTNSLSKFCFVPNDLEVPRLQHGHRRVVQQIARQVPYRLKGLLNFGRYKSSSNEYKKHLLTTDWGIQEFKLISATLPVVRPCRTVLPYWYGVGYGWVTLVRLTVRPRSASTKHGTASVFPICNTSTIRTSKVPYRPVVYGAECDRGVMYGTEHATGTN